MRNNKLQVDIFVPLNTCACIYESFMDRIFKVLTEFLNYIDFETKSLDSEEAKQMKLHENCVVIEGNTIITSSFKLKQELPIILKQKSLI